MIGMTALILVILGILATAQDLVPGILEEPCIADGGPQNCVKNFACIGDQGRWFEGRAIGWNSGILVGRTSDGVFCTGAWKIESSGRGRTDVSCEDGTSAGVFSEYQDHATGTSVGEGVTSEGDKIRSFSGQNVVEFLREDGVPVLPCGDSGIELDHLGVPIS